MGEEGPNNTLPVFKKKKRKKSTRIVSDHVMCADQRYVCTYRLTVLVMHISVTTIVRENEEDELGL